MDINNLLTLIGIIIALAAYVAAVRGRILDKISAEKEDNRKQFLKRYAQLLMFADVPLVISGASLSIFTASKIFTLSDCECLFTLVFKFGIAMFAVSLFALMCFHAYEWHRSWKS